MKNTYQIVLENGVTVEVTDKELLEIIAKRIIEKNIEAFKVLAQWLCLMKIKFYFYNN